MSLELESNDLDNSRQDHDDDTVVELETTTDRYITETRIMMATFVHKKFLEPTIFVEKNLLDDYPNLSTMSYSVESFKCRDKKVYNLIKAKNHHLSDHNYQLSSKKLFNSKQIIAGNHIVAILFYTAFSRIDTHTNQRMTLEPEHYDEIKKAILWKIKQHRTNKKLFLKPGFQDFLSRKNTTINENILTIWQKGNKCYIKTVNGMVFHNIDYNTKIASHNGFITFTNINERVKYNNINPLIPKRESGGIIVKKHNAQLKSKGKKRSSQMNAKASARPIGPAQPKTPLKSVQKTINKPAQQPQITQTGQRPQAAQRENIEQENFNMDQAVSKLLQLKKNMGYNYNDQEFYEMIEGALNLLAFKGVLKFKKGQS